MLTVGLIRGRVPNLPQAIYEYTSYTAGLSFSPNDGGRRSSSSHLVLRRSLVHTTIFQGNSKRPDPVRHHGMSPTPEGVSHPGMLLFALRRCKDQSSRRPQKIELTSIQEMSDMTVFQLDGSYLYQRSNYPPFVL